MGLSWTFLWTQWKLASLDWQATATLIAGVLAVQAARSVGKKQTEILNRQNELKSVEIKLVLLDRRMDIIRSMELFAQIVYPQASGQIIDSKPIDELLKSLRIAELIYPEEIHEELRGLVDRTLRLRSAHNKHNANFSNMNEKQSNASIDDLLKEELDLSSSIAALSQRLVAHARVDL